jgi:hypothetical protein
MIQQQFTKLHIGTWPCSVFGEKQESDIATEEEGFATFAHFWAVAL